MALVDARPFGHPRPRKPVQARRDRDRRTRGHVAGRHAMRVSMIYPALVATGMSA